MKKHFAAIASTALLALCAALPSHADTMVVEQTGLITGRQSFVIPITVSGSGLLSVNLKDLGWAGALNDLSFSLSRTGGLMSSNPVALDAVTGGPSPAPQGLKFDISEAGTYYACISGAAGGPYNLGLYGISIAFAAAEAPTVALPGALWLLLSGVGGLFGMARRRGLFPTGAQAATAS